MTAPLNHVSVALEVGSKRTFASALDWPGWARSGRDEAAALEALLAYGRRYQGAVRSSRQGFQAPEGLDAFDVFERLPGNPTTDFGAPDVEAAAESAPVDGAALERLQSLLKACWTYFAEVVEAAGGRELRKGPRGGGRSVEGIVDHVVDAHYNYLRRIYRREPREHVQDTSAVFQAVMRADEGALAFAASDEMPETGPRGGALWKPRYFVRRAAWHILDHAWEIEDRVEG